MKSSALKHWKRFISINSFLLSTIACIEFTLSDVLPMDSEGNWALDFKQLAFSQLFSSQYQEATNKSSLVSLCVRSLFC